MVKFGRTITDQAKPEWVSSYLRYNELKKVIKSIRQLLNESGESNLEEVNHLAEQFAEEIDCEIGGIVDFYSDRLREIKENLETVRLESKFIDVESLPVQYERCKHIAKLALDSIKYLELNSEGVRKILKKAEKLLSNKLICKNSFLVVRLRPDNADSRLSRLKVTQGITLVIEELRQRLDHMRSLEHSWKQNHMITSEYIYRVHGRRDTVKLLRDLHTAVQTTLDTTKWYYGLLAQAHVDYESDPVGDSTFWGKFLNQYNTFLYMSNYYIIIPTASRYAVTMGLSPTTSGLLLAMTPLSSLLASVIYSLWSNRNFLHPMLFCTVILIIGNLFYAMAYDLEAPWMLFLGRLLVGLGGNRAVNRRYISDFVNTEERSFQSAVFVAVGALGMTMGPGSQPLLNLFNFKIPVLGFTFNELTASGYIMVILWICFLFKVIFFFEEPVRHYAVSSRTATFDILDSFDSPLQQMDVVLKKNTVDYRGAGVCLVIYFVLKMVQETFQNAAPLVTQGFFDWTASYVGFLLAIIGCLVIPATLIVGWIGNSVDNRLLQNVSLFVLFLGCALSLVYPVNTFTTTQYCIAALVLYLSAQILEGVNMALISRVMPKIMSKGLLNAGFLATEFGTSGRVVGGMIIWVVGSFTEDLRTFQNLCMVPCMVFLFLALGLTQWQKDTLVPHAERMNPMNEADEMLSLDYWNRELSLRPIVSMTSEMSIAAEERRIID